jgi:phycocyanobilin lyase beta subunit
MTNSAWVSELIRSVEQADSPARLVAAVRALAEARLEAGIPTLIAVLGYNNPEAAVAAVEGLVQLGEVAVPLIVEQLDDYNYGARAYSFRALAAIGDPRAFNTLLNAAATDFAPSVRRAAAKGLGYLRWVRLPAAQRQLAQEQALKTLLSLCDDPEWAIRYAAVVGLQALAAAEPAVLPNLVSQIWARFEQIADADAELAVRARVWLAQRQLQASSGRSAIAD